ncbi:hypothetical protein FRC01_001991 [Tulasnella sp. 417]|nr:hypothetical protein FRC01_001991 [Tulasnella sp. 417]
MSIILLNLAVFIEQAVLESTPPDGLGQELLSLTRRQEVPRHPSLLEDKIGNVYKDMDVGFKSYPDDNTVDPDSYKKAIDDLAPGSAVVIIFTPNTTHHPIAKYALERKMHILVTKPATKPLEQHQELIALAQQNGVTCWVKQHKRYDPAYADAKLCARALGEFNLFQAWMSQPKSQLGTFRAWAGKDSDISYYLSSHHIDIHSWYIEGKSIPTLIASAATSIATSEPYNCVEETEDTITLMVDWQSIANPKHKGTAVYTSSWTAPLKAGIYSAQYFHYMGQTGEIRIDQAYRGYYVTEDASGKSAYNPFYMKYSPSETGHFDGQRGYGYVSIDKFVDAARSINAGASKASDHDGHGLPTIKNTVLTTAILNAGRISLDEKREVKIERDGENWKLV